MVALGLGMLGVILPLLPTTPLVLLAAFCFSKGSPRLQAWLLRHKQFGPMIRDWQAHGAIDRRAKRMAAGLMTLTFLICVALGLPVWVLAVQATCLIGAGTYVWTRPDA